MPYVSGRLVRDALSYLVDHTHPSLMSLLAALRKGMPASGDATQAIVFGAPDENGLMAEYFSPQGGPSGEPFFVPFGPHRGVSRWRDHNYAGRALQRQRQDRGAVYRQHPTQNRRWSFQPDYQHAILQAPTEVAGTVPLRLVWLAIWCYRDRPVESLPIAVSTFIEEFRLDRDHLIGQVFSSEISDDIGALPLNAHGTDPGDLLAILESFQPQRDSTPTLGSDSHGADAEAGSSSEPPGSWEVDSGIVTNRSGLVGVAEPATRALAALRSGMHVIFTGAPGSGKTTLAQGICSSAGFPFWSVTATDQWTTFETIGGYFPQPDGSGTSADRLDFLPGHVVQSIMDRRCLIVDEINRADIDKAFGELFTLLSGFPVTLPYRRRTAQGFSRRLQLAVGVGGQEAEADVILVPPWWRILGAMNDADKASLKRMSLAFVRRFAFVPVDLPGPGDYADLLRRAASAQGGPVSEAPFVDSLILLFARPDSGFQSIGFPFGPAIPLAMIRHAKAEWELAPARQPAEVLTSALDLYVAPQLQGRADLHNDVLGQVGPYLQTQRTTFEGHLAVWTGYVS